jgi:Na+/proline symporter
VILAQFTLFLFIGASLWVFYGEFPPSRAIPRSDERFTYFIVHYLPTGVIGLVIAAIFSAAMGTLAGSLNAAASTIVNDLYRPLTGRQDERHLVRVGRAMTILWGAVLTAVAVGATHLEDNVVNNALAVASVGFGILLGLFLLGFFTRRVGEREALAGVLAGIVIVTLTKFATPLAWPWFALIGSSAVFMVGLGASSVSSLGSRAQKTRSVTLS